MLIDRYLRSRRDRIIISCVILLSPVYLTGALLLVLWLLGQY